MKTDVFKITIHMVSSLDGFIASTDGGVSWMKSHDQYEDGVELTQEYINDFLAGIDCYVIGSGTYEHALELGWPYGDTPVIVLTSRDLKSERKMVQFYGGDLKYLVDNKLKPNYQNVWMGGGAQLTKEFLRQNLADELVVSILPVILGGGKLFFDFIGQKQLLHLEDVKAYKDGMVELRYFFS